MRLSLDWRGLFEVSVQSNGVVYSREVNVISKSACEAVRWRIRLGEDPTSLTKFVVAKVNFSAPFARRSVGMMLRRYGQRVMTLWPDMDARGRRRICRNSASKRIKDTRLGQSDVALLLFWCKSLGVRR